MTAAAQWSADPTKRTVGTLVLTGPNGGDIDLIASNAIRSGEIAAYIEMRDESWCRRRPSSTRSPARLARALSDRTVAGTPVTSGAQAGFDVDLAGLINGNSVQLDLHRQRERHAAHSHAGSGRRSALPCHCRIRRLTIRTTRSSASIFRAGIASVVSQLTAALGPTGLQFSNPSGTTLRVLDDGGSEQCRRQRAFGDQHGHLAHRRHARTAVLPRWQCRLYGAIRCGRTQTAGICRPHRGQCQSRGRPLKAGGLPDLAADAGRRSDTAEFHL